MTIEEALKNINKFKESIEFVQKEYTSFKFDDKKYNDAISENKKLKNDLTELKFYNSIVKLHLSRFKSLLPEHEICPNCNGEGGFMWEIGDGGCDGEPCNICEGSGIVLKSEIIEIPEQKPTDCDNDELHF